MTYCSALARNKAQNTSHTTINWCLVLPAMSLPLPVRRLEPAHHIVGDAVSARFGLIRATGGVLHNFSLIARNKAQNTSHTTINRRLILPAMSLPRPVRCLEPARRILRDTVSARIDLIRATGSYYIIFHSSLEIRRKKAHPHTTINRRVIQLATPLPRPVRRVDPARRILFDEASPRFGLIRAGGGARHPLPSSRKIRRKKAHQHTIINRRVIQLATLLLRLVRLLKNRAPHHGRCCVYCIRFDSSRRGRMAMLRKKGHPHTTINRRLVQLATPLTRPVRRFSITGNVVSPGFCLI